MHVSLEGYVVRRTTEKAVGLAKSRSTILHDDLTWVPRSVCEDGDALADTPINLDGALDWGRRQGLKGLDEMQFMDAVRAVNAERERHQLPRFRVIVPAAGA